MVRRQIAIALFAVLMAGVFPAASVARAAKPTIKASEVGYFGSLLTTRQVDVFVYSTAQPRARTHVKICVRGVCKRARGHRGKLAWYMASFPSRLLHMWAPVTYSAFISTASGRTKATATKQLLCIHNSGSTPTADPY